MNKSNTEVNTTVEWKDLLWCKLEKATFKLQKRIYQASQRNDHRTVKRLQKTLIRSWSAKCLAVRKISQENQGKKTAGVDGRKSLNPTQRLTLVRTLKLSGKAKPTRRVWIPKPGKKEMRPLGIPTMYECDSILRTRERGAYSPRLASRAYSHPEGASLVTVGFQS